jgi:transcriptional regulator with XRE-family HTH domain
VQDPTEAVVLRLIELLVEERKSRAISQRSLAALAGISRTGLRSIESLNYMPTLASLLRICDALGVDPVVQLAKARSAQHK